MAKVDLTNMFIKSIKDIGVEYSDIQVRGLRIRTQKTNEKIFSLMYNFEGNKRRITLGSYPVLSLYDARQKALFLKKEVKEGRDPRGGMLAQAYSTEAVDTRMESLFNIFLNRHAKQRIKKWKDYRRCFEKFNKDIPGVYLENINIIMMYDYFSAVKGINPEEKEAIMPPKEGENNTKSKFKNCFDSKGVANFTYKAVKSAISWLYKMDYIQTHPIQKMTLPFPEETKKEGGRILSDDELVKIIKSTKQLGYPYHQFFKIIALTGMRRVEASKIKWTDLDVDRKFYDFDTLSLPFGNTKGKRKHIIPLSNQSSRIIKDIKKVSQTYIFTSTGKSHINSFDKWIESIREISGVDNWGYHDLRRTLTTRLANKMGVPPIVQAVILNHSLSTQKGKTTDRYNRHDYINEAKQALQDYADWLENLVGEKL